MLLQLALLETKLRLERSEHEATKRTCKLAIAGLNQELADYRHPNKESSSTTAAVAKLSDFTVLTAQAADAELLTVQALSAHVQHLQIEREAARSNSLQQELELEKLTHVTAQLHALQTKCNRQTAIGMKLKAELAHAREQWRNQSLATQKLARHFEAFKRTAELDARLSEAEFGRTDLELVQVNTNRCISTVQRPSTCADDKTTQHATLHRP